MPKIAYRPKNIGPARMAVIGQANTIIAEYQAQGYDLTLRQLFYQFVSRDLIKNTMQQYKLLGDIINDGRLAGFIDWTAITDRTRNVKSIATWEDPSSIIDSAARSFCTDKWENQPCRPEVWIEKDALVGVIDRVCTDLEIPYFSCRGYTSQSELWAGAQRLIRYARNGQVPIILHLGDHDPSGLDMTRDIADRMAMFFEYHGQEASEVRRLALNMDQIEQYDPPPNVAKITDGRAEKYIEEFGEASWELDALDPAVLAGLVETAIEEIRDAGAWEDATQEQETQRELLTWAAQNWEAVTRFIDDQQSA